MQTCSAIELIKTNDKRAALDDFRANGVSIAPANIPQCLTSPDFKQWMCWQARAEANNDGTVKIKKPPYNPHNGHAGSKVKPAHWSNFADAIAAMERYGFDGVGIVLTADDDLVVLDLDNAVDVRTDGGPKDWAADIIAGVDSFTEKSPSGTGYHVVCRGKVPDGTPTVFKHHDGKVEAFRAGSFVTITGVHPDGIDHGVDVENRQQELDTLLEKLKPSQQNDPPSVQDTHESEMPPLRDDLALLEKSLKWKGKDTIGILFNEGPKAAGVDDHSSADMMLAGHLVWLLGKDAQRIDRLFRESACMRPKWDELRGVVTYGARTVNEAINTTEGTYSPRRKEGPRPSDPPDDACIVVRPGEIARVADEIEALYLKPDLGMRFQVFQRDRQLVRVFVSPVHDLTQGDRKKVAPAIAPLDKPYLASTASRLGTFVKFDARKGEYAPCNPPMDAIDQLLANSGNWRVPALRSIVGSPTMRPDGTILNTEGFDAATGCYLAEALPLTVPENPAREDAKAALRLLWNELFAGFCFVDELDRVVAFTALLSAVMRPMLRCAPLFIVTATTSGSGKSLLVDLIAQVAIGKTAPAVAVAHDEKEFDKTLGAVLMEGVPYISLDNINGKLESNLLCQAVTQDSVKPRVLGESTTRDIPNTAFMVANGNNISIAGDLARRTLLCRMDPGVERPELRRFDFNPLERAKQNRARYVSAVLTILRAYHCAGRPRICDPLAGFEDWGQTVRAALMWVQDGTPIDPVKSQETLVSEDGERAALRAFLTLWRKCLGSRPRTGGEVVLWAKDAPDDEDAAAFVDALREVASDRRGELNPMTLVKFLNRNAGRVMERHKLVKAGTYGAKPLWKVEMLN